MVRLERSLHLLRTTRMPLEQIACAVGLADAATLHRLVEAHGPLTRGVAAGRRSEGVVRL